LLVLSSWLMSREVVVADPAVLTGSEVPEDAATHGSMDADGLADDKPSSQS